jgi:hypothetical protein
VLYGCICKRGLSSIEQAWASYVVGDARSGEDRLDRFQELAPYPSKSLLVRAAEGLDQFRVEDDRAFVTE